VVAVGKVVVGKVVVGKVVAGKVVADSVAVERFSFRGSRRTSTFKQKASGKIG